MTDNDYIAEYVKERCPELLDTVDFNVWRLRKATEEAMDVLYDRLSNISKAWEKLNKTESEEKGRGMTDKEKFVLDELSKESPMVISTAYLYAKNYVKYGCDITKAWNTAVEQASILEKVKAQARAEAYESLWIPVSERLPEDYEEVIASVDHEYVYSNARHSKEYGWEWAAEASYDYWTELKGVDAWIPLPKAYKAESEEKK